MPVLSSIGGVAPGGGPSVADRFADAAYALGVRLATGLIGGPIVALCEALGAHPGIRYVQCASEQLAGFAAVEASLESNAPVLCVVTTGVGIVGVLPGLAPGKPAGATVILASARHPAEESGSGPPQETSWDRPLHTLGADGSIFDLMVPMGHPAELTPIVSRLRCGIASRPQGFMVHVSIPIDVLSAPCDEVPDPQCLQVTPPAPGRATVVRVAALLRSGPFAVLAGFGARHAQAALLDFLAQTGAPAMVTPRGMGIVPHGHPQFVGVTGMLGNGRVAQRLDDLGVERLLVLGTRLAQPSRGSDEALWRPGGLVYVDVDPTVAARTFHGAEKLAVHSDVGEFLAALQPVGLPRRPFHPYPDQEER